MEIVLEKNRVPHQAGMTVETEKFVVPLPPTTSVDMALKILWQVAMALDWKTASLADFPPRCYIDQSGIFCIYLQNSREVTHAESE